MEVLFAVFEKFSEALIEEYAGMFFVALVVVRANDDSEKCRVAAGELLKLLWRRLDDAERAKMAEVVKSWVAKRNENETLAGAAMGVLGLLVETGENGLEEVTNVIEPVLSESAARLQEAEEEDEIVDLDYTLPHQTLSTTAKLVLATPSSSSALPWSDIVPHLLFPHDYVRYDTAKLLSNLFANGSEGSAVCEMLGDELCLDIARKGCLVLKGNRGDSGEWIIGSGKLADEIVKVLWNISKHWAVSGHYDNCGKILMLPSLQGLSLLRLAKKKLEMTMTLRSLAEIHSPGLCPGCLSWPVTSSSIGRLLTVIKLR